MKLNNKSAQIFIPDKASEKIAFGRTTHLGIGAHQDDLETIAYHGILNCFGSKKKWFLGVTVTDGAGSARSGIYSDFSDGQMKEVRNKEQEKAAFIGNYSASILLDYPSSAVKNPGNFNVKEDLKKIIKSARPEYLYTHCLTDKHDTHISVVLKVIEALRELDKAERPKYVYGCEAWRDLDWMIDSDKVVLDVSKSENLASSLIGVFDSQISGGKRYDLAIMGRRKANATFLESHKVDTAASLIFAMDLTPLVNNPGLDIKDYTLNFISKFSKNVADRINRLQISD